MEKREKYLLEQHAAGFWQVMIQGQRNKERWYPIASLISYPSGDKLVSDANRADRATDLLRELMGAKLFNGNGGVTTFREWVEKRGVDSVLAEIDAFLSNASFALEATK